jgi:asparagine synthase (glutamine-hydrolysing)
MCGINGIALSSKSRRSLDHELLCRMRDVIIHRGPDDGGIFIDGNVGLGHRLLAIVDVAHGHQPMFNEEGSVAIVYNGEVYNHSDYRAELEAKGHVYKTHCDTETIVHLYEEYGPECTKLLRGMFAFAIWDKRKKELFIARDRLGVKPLYYVHDSDGSLFFASEIKSLLEAGAVRAVLNYAALPDQLANHGTSGVETLFRGVKRLLPGHTLTWNDGRVQIQKYWDVSFEPKPQKSDGATDSSGPESDVQTVDAWRELFKKSVELRLMADVPLGMFLSGGIDSSAIAAMMSQMVREPIKTFSVAFEEREANELEYARLVARKFGTDHHEIIVSPQQFFHELPNLIWHEDEPLGFIASVPLYFVSKLASEHVKVVLTGEGSDEILGGYGRYEKTLSLLKYGRKYESLVPQFARSLIKSGVPANSKLSRTFLSRNSDLENLYFDNFAVFNRSMQAGLLSDSAKETIGIADAYDGLRNWVGGSDAVDPLDRMLYADTKTYLHELLMKQDQMSMAASIESRVPFLDHKLVEFTARLPHRMKIRGSTGKWILREAMRGILPDEILTRKKMGFPVPVGSWFRNEFRHVVDEFVLSERALQRGVFNSDFVRRLVSRHRSGENHDERIWFLVNFEIWQRRFLDGVVG